MLFMMHRTTTPTSTPCEENEVYRERERKEEDEEEIDSLTNIQTQEIKIFLPNSSNVEKERKKKTKNGFNARVLNNKFEFVRPDSEVN